MTIINLIALDKSLGGGWELTDSLDEQTIELSKNGMLLLYTDGIPDATNAWDKRFGLNRIVRTINRMLQPSAQMICSQLIQAVTEHQGDDRQDDDMTVIVVRAV